MYSRILVPLDGSAIGERGLQEGLRMASAMKTGVVLLHIVDDLAYQVEMAAAVNAEDLHKVGVEEAQALLARAAEAAGRIDVPAEIVLREVKNAKVADVILQEAKSHLCDLIVMGTHGRRGLGRMALGSDAEQVVRRASIPVTLVRLPETA